MIVAERIQMILADMEGGAVMDGEEEWEKTLDGLEEAQRKAIEGYLDQTVFRQAATESICTLQAWKMGSVCWIGACQTERRNGKGDPLRSFLFTWKRKREKPE
ncbi:MAG: hypothetical protein ACLU8D_11880 [Enterocloster sp.]